ncbi:MAG: LptF/LptG family permease [Betaproteobacteria bacterium]|nr:LptF/LptG family permease [Betaproteobacteria bacterium]
MIYRKAYFADCVRHMGAVFPAVLAVGGLIFLSRLLGETVAGALPLSSLWHFLALTLVKYLPQLLTVSLFAGILLALERSFYRREMTAWHAAGLGLRHFAAPGAAFALPVVCIIAVLSCALSPWSVRAADSLRARLQNDINPQNIAAGEFVTAPGGAYTYFLRGDETDSGNIFIAANGGEAHEIISARAAARSGKSGEFILLEDGAFYRRPREAKTAPPEMIAFERMRIHIPPRAAGKERPRGAKFGELEWRSPPDRAEITWRINQPLAALFFALLAPLLAASFAGGKHRHSFLLALLLFIIHLNLMYFVRDRMADNAMPAVAGILLAPAAVLLAALLVRRAAAP